MAVGAYAILKWFALIALRRVETLQDHAYEEIITQIEFFKSDPDRNSGKMEPKTGGIRKSK